MVFVVSEEFGLKSKKQARLIGAHVLQGLSDD